MARPAGILTRRVTFGPAFTLGLGTPLSMAIKVKPSTSVVWAATGAPLIGILEAALAETGMQGYMDLPLPGQDGFVDGNGNQVKDFTYRADVTYLDGTRVVGDGFKVFSLLPGEGDVDLDTMIPVTSNAGVTVSIPDSWTIAYDRAVELAESFPDSDTLPRYVEGELRTPDGDPIDISAQVTSENVAAALEVDGPAKDGLTATFATVLVYADGAYPARPAGAAGGLVKYIGPVQPTTWFPNDEWVNNA
jgi:hypothetical protein